MPVVLIGLGTNQDREYNILMGLAKMQELFEVLRIASVFETAPVGIRSSKEGYFNSCVLAAVDTRPDELRQRLREIEAGAGRDRTIDSVYRPLDLDILAFGSDVEDIEWFANPAMAAFVAPLEELGFTPEPQPVDDAQAVCVWRRMDVSVSPPAEDRS